MTDAPNDRPITHQILSEGADGLGFDKIETERLSESLMIRANYERYAHFLDGIDASDEEKRAFVQTVWNIVFSVASLGFEAHPVQVIQKICGKSAFREAARQKSLPEVVE